MKIQQKLLLSYLIIIALVVAAGATITYNSIEMASLQNNAKTQQNINDNAYDYQRGLDEKQFGSLMYSADEVNQGVTEMVDSATIQSTAQIYLLNVLASDPSLLAEFKTVVSIDTNQINPAINQIHQIYDSNVDSTTKYTEIWNQMTIIMNATSQADNILAQVRNTTQTNVANAVTESQNYSNLSIIIAVGFIAGIVAASVVLSVVIGKRITVPLKNLSTVAQKVSQGDLDQRYYLKQNTDPKKGDEIDELSDAFKKMINAFRMQEALLKEGEGQEKRDA